MRQIILEHLDKDEALRYLGYKNNGEKVGENIEQLLEICEKSVLEQARPLYVYRVFDISECEEGIELIGTGVVLKGKSIKEHLKGCKRAVVFGATVSLEIDRLIRITQTRDMAEAMIIDSLSSVAVEQVCDQFEGILKEIYSDCFQTFRFGIGYGDLPIEQQRQVLKVIDAEKKIGLSVTPSNMLNPTKSVTAIIGLSHEPVKKSNRGCQTCDFRDKCQLSKNGGHCNG